MSVVTTIISQYFTVHASDSYLTEDDGHGVHTITEKRATKIISVNAWRGAICYWGLADLKAARTDRYPARLGYALLSL